MKRAIFFVLLLALEYTAYSQNLVTNPGFETWEKTNRPSGWIHVENCLIDSLSVNSGNYSCLHSGGATTTSDLGQTIPVVNGKEYLLSLYYKTLIIGSGNGARIWCYWKDAEGNNIMDPATDAILRPSKFLKSDTWQQLSLNIVAPSEARAFYLEVRTYPNSSAWWDDFVFEETVATWKNERSESSLNIYPNPAGKMLYISNIHNLQRIDIHALTGVRIWSSSLIEEQNVAIPVTGLPAGEYIIRIVTSDKLIARKFIKKAD